jgi:hypothetical protein
MNLELLFMFVPVIVVVATVKYFFHETITWGELAIQIAASTIIVAGTYQAGLNSRMKDREFLNGVVIGKDYRRVSCEHSYSCNCSTDSTGSTSCSTCYEHFTDYDWEVYTDAGPKDASTFLIDRVDRQGWRKPARWDAVQLGEPVALEHAFDNYILAAPDSLFHKVGQTRKLPGYPASYDYHRADRVIADGVSIPDIKAWNADLTTALSVIGPKKQANVVIVFTNDPSTLYAEDLRTKWLGGKKNDIVAVIGTPNYPEIAWAQVFSWSKKDLLNVSLRNDLTELGRAERGAVLATIETNVMEHFERRPMAEYEYLKGEIEPTPAFRIVGWILAILAPLALGLFFHIHDTFGNETNRRFRLHDRFRRTFPNQRRFR